MSKGIRDALLAAALFGISAPVLKLLAESYPVAGGTAVTRFRLRSNFLKVPSKNLQICPSSTQQSRDSRAGRCHPVRRNARSSSSYGWIASDVGFERFTSLES